MPFLLKNCGGKILVGFCSANLSNLVFIRLTPPLNAAQWAGDAKNFRKLGCPINKSGEIETGETLGSAKKKNAVCNPNWLGRILISPIHMKGVSAKNPLTNQLTATT